ncbi:MAG TPA: ribbon-helix-helix protein, CopG family [bacterium]|nr:ribbon-helix-helix protein, CopG family [bacterium]HQG44648.1 ribbon-helix-helix protein, CopG family [bacterium]HQI48364.1 ribbon-helix-helix protein, CopG family [bacterium]HQJ63125.1 ribbon-helix-helix protein, CopG family [bacterium]
MAIAKTAISIQKPLLDKVDTLAKDLSLSRSKIFTLAVEAYLEQLQNQILLEKIDEAFSDPDPREQGYLAHMRRRQRHLLEDTW